MGRAEGLMIHPLECGAITAPANVFQEDLTGVRTVPVMAFLIAHPDARPRRVRHRPAARHGRQAAVRRLRLQPARRA
jgi:hypothetical protein